MRIIRNLKNAKLLRKFIKKDKIQLQHLWFSRKSLRNTNENFRIFRKTFRSLQTLVDYLEEEGMSEENREKVKKGRREEGDQGRGGEKGGGGPGPGREEGGIVGISRWKRGVERDEVMGTENA